MLTKQRMVAAIALVGGLSFGAVASAAPVTMTFDELAANGENVASYYDGGCGGSYNSGPTTCGGPEWGVVWSGVTAGGAPNGLYVGVGKPPSPPNVIGILTGDPAIMSVAGGFRGSLSAYYASPYFAETITIYDGLNGTGTLLATLNLPQQANIFCDGKHLYSCWDPASIDFDGIAQSAIFGNSFARIDFDSVTINLVEAAHDVPEPASVGASGFGLVLLGGLLAFRRRQVA